MLLEALQQTSWRTYCSVAEEPAQEKCSPMSCIIVVPFQNPHVNLAPVSLKRMEDWDSSLCSYNPSKLKQ